MHRANHDSLTGLLNRAGFAAVVDHALARLERRSETLAVMFIDLDDFKSVNDAFGHLAGDCVLVAIGDRLRAAVRSSDTLARVGGDEFVVLSEDLVGSADAIAAAERVIQAVSQPLDIEGELIRVSASVGVVTRTSRTRRRRNSSCARTRPCTGPSNSEAADSIVRARSRPRVIDESVGRARSRRASPRALTAHRGDRVPSPSRAERQGGHSHQAVCAEASRRASPGKYNRHLPHWRGPGGPPIDEVSATLMSAASAPFVSSGPATVMSASLSEHRRQNTVEVNNSQCVTRKR